LYCDINIFLVKLFGSGEIGYGSILNFKKENKMIHSKSGIMYRRLALLIFTILLPVLLYAQETNLKQKAIKEFKDSHYTEAISLLKKAALVTPDDAEVYYYLGRFSHYLCYDVGPRKYDEEKSNEIIRYLDKAVLLDPHLGNAYYYIGVEYGMRGHFAMIEGNIKKAKKEFRIGGEKGGYPDWLLEYARNMLRSCARNAILFTGGDAEANSAWYLQLVENYRADISVIPIGLLNFSPFVLYAKKGLDDLLVGVPISKTDEQIRNAQILRWKPQKIKIPISEIALNRFKIPGKITVMEWELKPDIIRDSIGFLMPGTAYIVDIVKTNKWARPIYFTVGSPPKQRAGLNSHLQLCGLTYRLLPVKAEKYGMSINAAKIESILLNPESYTHFKDVKEHNMPRVSFILNNYRGILMRLAGFYLGKGDKKKAREILNYMQEYMPENALPMPPPIKKMMKEILDKIMNNDYNKNIKGENQL